MIPALSVIHALQRLGHQVRFVCLGPEAWRSTADAGVERVKLFAPTLPAFGGIPEQWRAGPLGLELARRAWSVAQDWGALFADAGAVLIDQTLPDIVLPALSRRLPVIILSTHFSYARRGATPPLTLPDTDARRGWAMVSEAVARTDLQLADLVDSRRLPAVMHPAFWRRWATALNLADRLVESCLAMLPGWYGLAELLLVPEQLELPGHHRAPGLHYLAPPIDPVRAEPALPRPARQLALCAFGSQLQNYREAELLNRAQLVIEALEHLPDCFLALQAPDRLRGALRTTDRVEVRSTWPQRQMLQDAALFITHCGVNSMLEAVSHGVRMVAQPLAWDQPGNAMRLEHHGLARCVREWTPAGVAAAVRDALALPDARVHAAAAYFPNRDEYDARLHTILPVLLEHASATAQH